MLKRSVYLLLVALTLATIASSSSAGNSNPGIQPLNSKFRGLSYSEWQAKWWQAAFDIPVVGGEHPLINGGPFDGDNGVVFLAAPVGVTTTIEVTIPTGTPLFFPIVNFECSVFEPDPFHGDDEESLRECANDHTDNTSGVSASIDGKTVKNITSYRTESDLFEWGPLPEDNIFQFFGLDAPEGTTSLAVDSGFYLLLNPLSKGQHVIHIAGSIDEFGTFVDTTFVIHVVPGGH